MQMELVAAHLREVLHSTSAVPVHHNSSRVVCKSCRSISRQCTFSQYKLTNASRRPTHLKQWTTMDFQHAHPTAIHAHDGMGEVVLAYQFIDGLNGPMKAKLVGMTGTFDELLATACFEEPQRKLQTQVLVPYQNKHHQRPEVLARRPHKGYLGQSQSRCV